MSDRLKSTNSVSNEDVIQDLTKNLEFSLRPDDDDGLNSNDHDNCASGDSSKASPSVDILLKDEEDEVKNEQSDKDDSDTDSIDELSLKDAEVDLTDDQKSERRSIAETLKTMGNLAFKNEEYERSIEKYTEALKICPLQFNEQRAVLYCNRSAAKLKLERYKHAIKDCTKAIELDDKYVKAYYRRAQCYEITEKLDESLEDYKQMLLIDPSHKEAQSAMVRLPPLIAERNDKLKTEMLDKLKDLGNMILKPFGLSTQNFQMEQDPETKGYKINFKQ
ncbi:tetratricopeptide repeat protein 1 [Vanessa cardui]|uniref:tetratricopeptide repeat protein 1 n=1 Tax=Vanessa cardui TaxID=171605 RepID=UPI001F148E32|nr:tetratricopeptide repeat protein 1 [Vanessa cardui]